jgi:outer membrane protein
MKRITILIPIFVLGLFFSANAQMKVWSLEECVQYALENNLSIMMQELNVELEKANLRQSKAMMLPDLNANATHGYNWGQTVDLYTNQFATERVQTNNFYLQTRVTLFNGFRLLNTVRQGSLSLMASKYNTDKMRNDIILNIVTAYMQVLFTYEQLKVSEGQVNLSKQQLSRTEEMVEAGAMPKGDLLSMEAQLASEELALISVENSLESAYLTLAQLMDLESDSAFTIAFPEIEPDQDSQSLMVPLNQIYNFAIENQPQIKSAELQLQSAETGIKIAKAGAWPSLILSGSLGTGYSGARKDYSDPVFTGFEPSGLFTGMGDTVFAPEFDYTEKVRPFGTQIDDNFNRSLSVYLTIPLFNGLQNHTQVQRARIARENAAYNLEIEKQFLMKDIQQAYADAKSAFKKYQAAEKSLKALKESFQYASEKFNLGMLNSVELNDAKNLLAQGESDLISAKYEYIFKTKILDFYLGKPIRL